VKCSYVSFVFELSLYYLLVMIGLPLVYAVTYHYPFEAVFTGGWLSFAVFLYPSVFFLAGLRYILTRWKQVNERYDI
jgi:hypothetical protein